MVYKQRFAAVIKHNGKVLREHDHDCVILPFGSEYSILLKNLESRKAVVSITIDGTDVLRGQSLLVEPNSTCEIDRFLDSMSKGKRFRFIEKTQQISDHRGDKIDDGLVRIEFRFERERQVRPAPFSYPSTIWIAPGYQQPEYRPYGTGFLRSQSFGACVDASQEAVHSYHTQVASASPSVNFAAAETVTNAVLNDSGITVGGSESHSSFGYGSVGELETNSTVIVLRLKGRTAANTPVQRPVTVKTKITCPTCGTKNKSTNKFCGRCATSLL